jgi:hypothetical protein
MNLIPGSATPQQLYTNPKTSSMGVQCNQVGHKCKCQLKLQLLWKPYPLSRLIMLTLQPSCSSAPFLSCNHTLSLLATSVYHKRISETFSPLHVSAKTMPCPSSYYQTTLSFAFCTAFSTTISYTLWCCIFYPVHSTKKEKVLECLY